MHHRFNRCAMVVENSLKLGQLERTGAPPLEQVKVVEASLNKLNDPY